MAWFGVGFFFPILVEADVLTFRPWGKPVLPVRGGQRSEIPYPYVDWEHPGPWASVIDGPFGQSSQ